MLDLGRIVKDSVTLDAAYFSRGIPAVIEQLANEAIEEVERARQRNDGDVARESDAAVVPG